MPNSILDDCQKAALGHAIEIHPSAALDAGDLIIGSVPATLEAFLSHPGAQEQLAKLLWEQDREPGQRAWDKVTTATCVRYLDKAEKLLDKLREELVDAG